MTAPSIKLADIQYPSALRGIRIPDRRKLAVEMLFGTSEAESLKNRADASRPAVVSGAGASIGYFNGYARVKSHASAGYGFLLPLGLLPAYDATLILVHKGGGGSQQWLAGIAASWYGFRYFGTSVYGSNGESANSSGANRGVPSTTDFVFSALVLSRENVQRATGGYGKFYYYSGGVQQVVTSAQKNTAGGRSAMVPRQIAIGGTTLTDSITTNPFDVGMFAMLQRTASPTEIGDIYGATVADFAARCGITVV